MASDGLPSGREHLCFDSTPLMAFAKAGDLDLLGSWFGHGYAPRVVIEDEVGNWVHKYPQNQDILDADWLECVRVDIAEDIVEVERVRRDYLGNDPGKDHGEAEVIVLCQRYGWTAALDDGEGRRYAARSEVQVPSTMMLTIIIAAAAEGLISPSDAWRVHADVDAARLGGRSYLTGQPVHRPAWGDDLGCRVGAGMQGGT
jgi:predicted nucleic acid-binding protein